MRTNGLVAAAFASVLALPCFILDGVGIAASGKGKEGNGGTSTTVSVGGSQARLRAKLLPVDSTSALEGHVDRRTRGDRDEFEARVEGPEEAFGTPLPLTQTLTVNGVQCMMVQDDGQPVGIVQYKTSIRQRGPNTANRAGDCGVPATIPNVADGHLASTIINGVTLQGTFATK